MYQALYRKWRPERFSDVVGQLYVTSTLKNAIQSGRVSHAYLFTGSRGTGKTTCAKILSRAINCLSPEAGEPCGKCENCTGIANGRILDVVEMDAASNNSVNNIRDLLDEVMFAPSEAKYRVYIIDEVHMLSIGAFNALLKTLEEPPAHVVFILATTEVHKLPATILSRCQRYDFGRISPEDIAARIEYICSQEQVNIEHDAAMLIGVVADGAVRDALSILDRCIALAGGTAGSPGNVTSEVVREVTGLAGRDYLFTLTDAVNSGDVTAAINIINELHNASKSMPRLCEELTEHFRTLMLLKTMKDSSNVSAAMTTAERTRALSQAESLTLTHIVYAIDTLRSSLERMFKGGSDKIELETCMIKLCNPKLSTDVQAILTRMEKLERALAEVRSGDEVRADVTAELTADILPTVGESATKEEKEVAVQPPKSKREMPAAVQDTVERTNTSAETPPTPMSTGTNLSGIDTNANPTDADTLRANAVLMSNWDEVLDVMKKLSRTTAAAFRGTTAYTAGNYIFIDAQDDAPFAHLRKPAMRGKMRDAIKQVTGKTYKLGPYKAPKKEEAAALTKLDEFINSLEKIDDIQLEISN